MDAGPPLLPVERVPTESGDDGFGQRGALGKIKHWDAIFYAISQFAGAAVGVALISIFIGKELADPAVDYVVTVPGARGPWVALAAEYAMALGMMSLVLYFSNHHKLDRYTGLFAGALGAAGGDRRGYRLPRLGRF